MVQDLVHPSMYPFVYGRSKFIQEEVVGVHDALDHVGKGATVPKDEQPESDRVFWSTTYQWLPSNISFGDDGTIKFTSYVNNLNPEKFPEIYETLERVIDKAIPAWDQCLHEYTNWKKGPIAGRLDSRFHKITEASDSDDNLWAPELDVAKFKDIDVNLTHEELAQLEDMACFEKGNTQIGWKAQHERMRQGLPPLTPNVEDRHIARAKWEKVREAKLPEPRQFEEIDYAPEKSLREKFKENGLQVIVKMASIELTPEKPEFPAGGWHMNEKICATALYYLDSDNVTPSHLSLRTQTDSYLNDRIYAKQDEYNWLERVYGTALRGYGFSTCVQNFGDVQTKQGRLLAFPNVLPYQTRSQAFHRPLAHRPSSAHRIHRERATAAEGLPQECAPEGLMSVQEAREHRLKLIGQRTRKNEAESWEKWYYSFCEH
ncbi:hypothetical protein B0J15DRAFT_398761 [Fusarium solani]|uniref:DUF4246 domain-containing protein n=1 Tax=Fusarium solani TaxID=169388 RepID=A0A9P9H9F6_FUSSL|nr:uncharacterized protein B0J15DRAFT_398761 [Fusarium solani]KAH7252992.1 hypothetical protein B0J15DRAFT_398761 [Fusarium solani]